MITAWTVEPGLTPAADSFGDLSGVTQDPHGNVYVSDRQASTIWIFDASGTLLRGLGGKGDGPGEFNLPSGVALSPSGRLYVRDVGRVTVFTTGPEGLLTVAERTFPGPRRPDWMSSRTTRFDTAGAMLYPGQRWHEDGTAEAYFIRIGPDGTLGDTIFVPRYETAPQLTAFYPTGPGSGETLRGLNYVPFSPLPVWDITDRGTVISGAGTTYRLRETLPPDSTLSVFMRDVQAIRIPTDQRNDSLAALRSRIDSIPVARSEVRGVPEGVWQLEVPEVFPAYEAVVVASDGRVWVRRWPVGRAERTVFDVFSRAGAFEHSVLIDRVILDEPTPVITSDAILAVTRSNVTGAYGIVQFEARETR
jgi:hypothetical protein